MAQQTPAQRTPPQIGEVREFPEHRPVPLREGGFAAGELIPLDVLIDPPELRLDPVSVKRRWDGERWQRITPP